LGDGGIRTQKNGRANWVLKTIKEEKQTSRLSEKLVVYKKGLSWVGCQWGVQGNVMEKEPGKKLCTGTKCVAKPTRAHPAMHLLVKKDPVGGGKTVHKGA